MKKCGALDLNIRVAGFPGDGKTIRVPAGISLLDVIKIYCHGGSPELVDSARLNGHEISIPDCLEIVIRENDSLSLALIPQGTPQAGLTKETMRLLGSVGVGLVGIAAPSILGLGGIQAYAVRAGITLLGILAINTLIPDLQETTGGNVDFSGTRNAFRPGSRVPMVYGKVLFAPPMCAKPYTEIRGGKLHLKTLYSLGYKPIFVHEDTIRIGDNSIVEYPSAVYRVVDGHTRARSIRGNFDLIIYNGSESIHEQILNDELKFPGSNALPWGHTVRGSYVYNEETLVYTTKDNTSAISVDLTFPSGLHGATVYDTASIRVQIQYQMDMGVTQDVQFGWTDILSDDFLLYMTNSVDEITQGTVFGWVENMALTFYDLVASFSDYPQSQWGIIPQVTSTVDAICDTMVDLIETTLSESGIDPSDIGKLFAFQSAIKNFKGVTGICRSVYSNTGILSSNVHFMTLYADAVGRLSALIPLLELEYMVYSGVASASIANSDEYRLFTERRQAYPDIFGRISSGEMIIENATKEPLRYTFHVRVPQGRYKIRVRKATENSSIVNGVQTENDGFEDTVYVTAVRSVVSIKPVSQEAFESLAFMEMEIPISETVNGSLNEVSMIVETPLQFSDDGINWEYRALIDGDGYSVSRNPAWIFVDMLVGNSNYSPVSLDQIDLPRIFEWADYCRTNGYYFDKVIESNDTLDKALDSVCLAGKAMKLIRDGFYSVAIDKPQDNLSMFITPYNSRDFSASKSMLPIPDALIIQFRNPSKDWSDDYIYVYNDGFGPVGAIAHITRRCTADPVDETIELSFKVVNLLSVQDELLNTKVDGVVMQQGRTSTTLSVSGGFGIERARYTVKCTVMTIRPVVTETISFDGMTDVPENPAHEYFSGQAERYGKYLIRAMVHRPEVFTVQMDYENLVAEVGDRVTLQHDIVLWGIGSGRIVSITRDSGGHIVELYVDQNIDLVSGTYAIKLRKKDNSLWGPFTVTYSTSTNNMFSLDEAEGSPSITWGDLIVWGEPKLASIDCVIRAIRPKPNLEAEVVLVEASPQIHDSDSEEVGEYNPNLTFPRRPDLLKPPAPVVTRVVTDESAITRDDDGSLKLGILIEYEFPKNPKTIESFNVNEIDAVDAQIRTSTFARGQHGAGHGVTTPPWTGAGKFDAGARKLLLQGVNQSAKYDVRLRSLTHRGVLSDWTYELGIVVYGTRNPPPDISSQTLRADGNLISWDYTPPIDFAGFNVRYSVGIVKSWDELRPAHNGLILETNFRLTQVPSGIFTFGVKAVDTGKNQSVNAAIAVLSTFDKLVGHPVDLIIQGPNNPSPSGGGQTWQYDINDMTEDYGSSGSTNFLYQDTKSTSTASSKMWPLLDLPAFGYDLSYPAFSRRYAECSLVMQPGTFDDYSQVGDYPAFFVVIFPIVDESVTKHWQLQRINYNALLWSDNDDDEIWLDSDDSDFWNIDGEWHAVTGPTKFNQVDDWYFRVWFPEHAGPTNAEYVMQELYYYRYFPVKTDRASVVTSALGQYTLYFGIDYFTEFIRITSVQLTIVENGSYPNVRQARVVSGLAPGGFTIRTYDGSDIAAQGEIIVNIEGF